MFATRVGFYREDPSTGVITVTGGTLTYDGSYSVRRFNSSGTLGISGGNLAVEYLVVGGGGAGAAGTYITSGGGAGRGGGGGEGGQVLTGSTTINSGSYAVTIGGSNQDTTVGAILTALRGNNGSTFNGGTGNPGANGGKGDNQNLGGTNATAGTDGTTSSITGTSIYYGGGGGGGARFPYVSGPSGQGWPGGQGGGGQGGVYDNSFWGGVTPGTGVANTGGGGGGGGSNTSNNGANGGSGVFIIRYLTAGTN